MGSLLCLDIPTPTHIMFLLKWNFKMAQFQCKLLQIFETETSQAHTVSFSHQFPL